MGLNGESGDKIVINRYVATTYSVGGAEFVVNPYVVRTYDIIFSKDWG